MAILYGVTKIVESAGIKRVQATCSSDSLHRVEATLVGKQEVLDTSDCPKFLQKETVTL